MEYWKKNNETVPNFKISIHHCTFYFNKSKPAFEEEINKLSSKMAKKIVEKKKKKLAVVDFTDLQGNVTELGRFISEEMSVSLAESGGFSIVDRTHLKALIKEHKLSDTGVINPETARKLGKISGVEALITGTITPFGEKVRIHVKVLDTVTAEIISSIRGNIAKTQGIEELLSTDISTSIASSTLSSGDTNKPKKISFKTSTDLVNEVEGFEFKLRKCLAAGSVLKCTFIITNLKNDRALRLHGTYRGRSRVINTFGDEFKSTGVQLGNSSGEKYTGKKMIPKNIPIKASVTYKIKSRTNFLSLVELSMERNVGPKTSVQFRNVAIELN